MEDRVAFVEVLQLLESHGWKLTGIWRPYLVFTKSGHLPILIPVHDRKVDIEYVRKINEILGRER